MKIKMDYIMIKKIIIKNKQHLIIRKKFKIINNFVNKIKIFN